MPKCHTFCWQLFSHVPTEMIFWCQLFSVKNCWYQILKFVFCIILVTMCKRVVCLHNKCNILTVLHDTCNSCLATFTQEEK